MVHTITVPYAYFPIVNLEHRHIFYLDKKLTLNR
jgi:hypothetical protein